MLSIDKTKQLFPIREGNIQLSLFQERDISHDYISWLNDPKTVQYSNQRFKTHTWESCKNYLDTFENANALFLSITDSKTQKMLGTMTVYFNVHHDTADIGIMIGNKNYWGQGIGQKAWLLLLTTLLKSVNVRKVTGGTLSCNYGMIKIMEKTGMKPDGTREKQEIVDGKAYDILHFSAFKDEENAR